MRKEEKMKNRANNFIKNGIKFILMKQIQNKKNFLNVLYAILISSIIVFFCNFSSSTFFFLMMHRMNFYHI